MNYARISEAIEFYKSLGYEYIETPWIVGRDVTQVTSGSTLELVPFYPSGLKFTSDLVGSAEQGFIQLMREGKLEAGKRYVSAGPCFRFADANRSPLHHPYFFKVELFVPDDVDYGPLLRDAYNFFWREQAKHPRSHVYDLSGKSNIVGTLQPHGYDLELNNIEIGSYGFRSVDQFSWSYGTGLAEPRFTQALEAK